jgi:hypothetical protein
MILNNELEKISKEVIVAQFMVLSQQMSAGTEENHKIKPF